MKVVKQVSVTKFLAQCLFLLLPTLGVVMYLLWNSTHYLTMLSELWMSQAWYFASGMFIAFFLYQFRFRFLPTFSIVLLLLFSGYKLIDNYSFSEFDGFFISVQFQLFAILFTVGWLIGWAFERVSYSAIIISGLFLLIGIFLISKTPELTPYKLLMYFSPLALYAVYLIYTQTSLRLVEHSNARFWLSYVLRILVFLSVLLVLFRGVVYFLYPEIKERVEEFGGQGKEGEGDMLKRNKDGSVSNKESMGLNGNNKKNNNPDPLFCAHIENYIQGTEIPNPLYLTAFHFTKYDTTTETFERDPENKYNDEFIPDPAKIPLFFTYKDSSRIEKARSKSHRKTVDVEVYKKRLSASAFLAPSTAYFVQPITVEKDFQKTFSSAYRTKSYVSDLNSAYFIYNSEDANIRAFQEQRFAELRKVKPFHTIDTGFFNYYTAFSDDGIYKPVKKLADSLARGKTTTIDKVLAIRDYFLKRNELGERTFTYTDNPGVPGLPGASKLLYFLFESKKGYCAYYAAATVFLLRSMKIPSRVVTGFLTVDRSDKNKGWYWFYEDQSHGWVQVYFPEYGWIDFDTTVGNDDAQQSPTPDGTPPLQPPNAVFAGKGIIQSVDTLKKTALLKLNQMVFKDVEFKKVGEAVTLDLHSAAIWKDSIAVGLNELHTQDEVMAVSYAERLKALSPEKNAASLLAKMPKEIPTDDVFIQEKKEKNSITQDQDQAENKKGIWYYIKHTLATVFSLFLILFSIPFLTWRYFIWRMRRSKNLKQFAYFCYKASSFLVHQLGFERGNSSMWQYARERIDPEFDTIMGTFMQAYLKQKYANTELSAEETSAIKYFYPHFDKQVRQAFKPLNRIKRFWNLSRYLRYFVDMED